MIETILNWLAGFTVDELGPGEGWAVFPQGERVLKRYPDILGGARLRKRLTFLIRRNSHPGSGFEMEAFALWAERSAPQLGENQTVRVEDARLAAKNKEAMARYEARLIIEFTT